MVKKDKSDEFTKTIDQMNDSERAIFTSLCSKLDIFPEDTASMKNIIYSQMNQLQQEFTMKIGSFNTMIKLIESIEK